MHIDPEITGIPPAQPLRGSGPLPYSEPPGIPPIPYRGVPMSASRSVAPLATIDGYADNLSLVLRGI